MFSLSDAKTGIAEFDRLISEMRQGDTVHFDGSTWTEYVFKGGVTPDELKGIAQFERSPMDKIGDFYRTTFGATVCEFLISHLPISSRGGYFYILMMVYKGEKGE